MARKNDHGKTASGKLITDDLIDELAARTEAGYNVEETASSPIWPADGWLGSWI